MKVGDKVYRVADGIDAFVIEMRTITKVTAKMCRLDRPFSSSLSTHGLIARTMLGRLFFATPGAAVDDLRRKAEENKAYAQREIKRAERLIDWCLAQRQPR